MSAKFQYLRSPVRDQVFWLISELTNLGAQHVDSLYLILMRQIRGGDTSQFTTTLCDHILRLFELHKSWLETNPKVIPFAVYTFLRAIADHRTSQLQPLQQKEIRFVLMLMREKWMHCVPIGRDLIRVLKDLSTLPEFAQFWDDMVNHPKQLSPKFGGVQAMLNSPTPKDFLKCRLTPDIEHKLLFILQNVRYICICLYECVHWPHSVASFALLISRKTWIGSRNGSSARQNPSRFMWMLSDTWSLDGIRPTRFCRVISCLAM